MMLGYFVVVPEKCADCGKKRRLQQVIVEPPKVLKQTKHSVAYSYAKVAWLCRQCAKKWEARKK